MLVTKMIGSRLQIIAVSLNVIIGVKTPWDGVQPTRRAIPIIGGLGIEVNAGVLARVREYFEAGVILVWLIDPSKRTARVFSTVEKAVLIRADQVLDGANVLPGFVVRLSDLLDRGRRPRRR
jgi:Putative restriction endonuclease